ncbi:MAG: choice-of-anchor B family protein [Longimicrobiales bacterium]|nr:choice-of-anchor B family protein [Longimicrobiales bacterium]
MKTFGRLMLLGATVALIGAPVSAQTSWDGRTVEARLASFGSTLAVAGGQVFVGESETRIRPGAVYVYEKEGSSWVEVQVINAPDPEWGDGFGAAISVSGSTMLVAGGDGVHVFSKSGGSWTRSGMIAVEAPTAMAVEGNHAVIGEAAFNDNTGVAHLFRLDGGTWTHTAMIEPDGLVANDRFGTSVDFDGDLALIGAPGSDNRAGTAYAFRMAQSGLELVGRLEAGQRRNDQLGTSVLIDGGSLVAGAPMSGEGIGAVYLFAEEEGEIEFVSRLSAFDGTPQRGRRDPGTRFGSAMTAAGDLHLIGSRSGVYAFDLEAMSVSKWDGGDLADGAFGAALAGDASLTAVAAPGAGRGIGAVAIYENGEMAGTLEGTAEEFDPVTGGEVRCEENQVVAWECSNVDLVSFLPISTLTGDGSTGINTNDNWGWQDPETDRKYAIVGMQDRTSFVDITDAVNPRVVGILMMTEGANRSAWRDMKVFSNHTFIVSDGAGQHGMQVFDLTRLRDHTSGDPVFFEADALYTDVASVHNIVINTDIGHAYAVGARGGGETCGGGLHIIDINDPLNPTFAGCFSDPQTGRAGTGYTHDAQCTNYHGPDTEWQGRAVCFAANETAISLADVTDPSNTIAISNATYPSPGYTHQGWLSDDHRWFFVNDELDEINGLVERTRTLVWDVSDLDDPQLVTEHLGTQESSDHNLYVQGNLMFQSNYVSGLRILDVSDPANPVEVAHFDTVPYGDNTPGFGGSWSNYPYFGDGTVLVTSGAEGMFIVRPTVRSTVF